MLALLLLAIPLAGPSAGAVRTPSSEQAWGGVRDAGPERVADYNLEAVLDPKQHTLEGKARLVWKNRSASAVDAVYVHLYLNAFEGPGSTFNVERKRYGGFRTDVETHDGEFGWIELQAVTQGGEKLPWTFVHPDGGPETDHTVARIQLAKPLPAGSTATIDFVFHDQLPRVVARTGYFGNYHLVAQWYPKIGVLELPGERGATEPRWNCHEFHLNSEFYADFGSYRAEITVPPGYTFGSTGVEIAPSRDGVHKVAQDDVHDFAFVASDSLQELRRGRVRVLAPAEYAASARDALDWTEKSIEYFSRTLGPYPYPQVTVVVPPFNAIESGGMEYETFFTTVGGLGPPLRQVVPFVTVHEFGHGYFMGLLASNEFEEPFLDEGLNEFWDARMLVGDPLQIPAPWHLPFQTPKLPWWDLERSGTARFQADPIAGNSWDRYSRGSYGLVYSRTTLVFHDLEQRLGGDVLARGFAEYYRRWHFRHPSTADLEQTLADVAGPEAALVHRWFAEQVYERAPVDDRVDAVESKEILPEPGRGVTEAQADAGAKSAKGKVPWRSTVVVRRYAAHVPETVAFQFENGATETVEWPEAERWHRYVFERPGKIVSAQLDPKRQILLDLNKLDDGRTREATPSAARRWTLEFDAWVKIALAMLEAL